MLGWADDLLKHMILERGLLTAEDLEQAVREQEEAAAQRGVAPNLGTVLVARGKLVPAQLESLLDTGVRTAFEQEQKTDVEAAKRAGLASDEDLARAEAEAARASASAPKRVFEVLLEQGTVSRQKIEDLERQAEKERSTVSTREALESKPRGSMFGKYQILAKLGKGGMGEVYRAIQPGLGRLVAIKILPPEMQRDPEFLERFNREAKALARLNHPNIVTVHDFGLEAGRYYIAMEFVDGANLRQLLKEKKLTAEQALRIVPQVCDALDYAHEEGVVHRDIKPENILLDKKGRV
jgi:predicted Ser/Thr protein kinase